MKISYLVTCNNETDTLKNLLEKLTFNLKGTNNEIVIIQDDTNKIDVKSKTYEILNQYLKIFTHDPNGEYKDLIKYWTHPLNNDYGSHKNFGNSKCSGDWIFQIDGDELPPNSLIGENLQSIIESNPSVELIYVPRINDFKGVTESHAKQWGWHLTYNARPSINDKILGPIVNWPDFQSRIYKRIPNRIKWDRKLHEKISGHTQYSFLPAEEEFALYHDKTIEKQIETNLRYIKNFTVEDNKGHTF